MTHRWTMDSNRTSACGKFTSSGVVVIGLTMLLCQPPLLGYAGDIALKLPLAGSSGAALRATKIAAGGAHNLLIAEDGTVWAWGHNDSGQVGDGTATERCAPVRVAGLSGVVAVAAGGYHSMALKSDGTVWAWGANESGQLGDGSNTARMEPVQVLGIGGVTAIAAGNQHSLALKNDGTIWSWGWNYGGQLANGTVGNGTSPGQVIGLSGMVSVAGGAYSSIALKNDGTVWVWGNAISSNPPPPSRVDGLSDVISVEAGTAHYVALKADGTVWGWGQNVFGELGDGTRDNRDVPGQVTGVTGVVAVSTYAQHTLALRRDGSVFAWGQNNSGQLGNGTTETTYTPVVVSGLNRAAYIAAGGGSSFSLDESGTLRGWGWGYFCQLGDGTATARQTLNRIDALPGGLAVAGGNGHSLMLATSGTVYAWGLNHAGQLGDNSYLDHYVAQPVSGLEGVMQVTGNGASSFALKSDGTVWAWGSRNLLYVGDGTTSNASSPAQVMGITDVLSLSAGTNHGLAVKDDTTVWVWGRNDDGQYGDGSRTSRSNPVQTGRLTDVVSVAGGEKHSLALMRDGTVWAWGANNSGQLGNGTTSSQYTPIQIPGLSRIVAIAGGREHSLALKNDGTVWAWGLNNVGQLGDGTTLSRLTPVEVRDLKGVAAISTSGDHNLALLASGAVWGWGSNSRGQLGDGTRIDRASAVPMAGAVGATSVAALYAHSLVLLADGSVLACGDNTYGQLGDRPSGHETSPVFVVPPGVPDLAIGMTHSSNSGNGFAVGTPAAYELTVTNSGPTSTAGNIRVVDTLPSGLRFSGSSGNDWNCLHDGQIVTCTSPGPIQPSTSSTLTLNVDVLPGAYPGVTNIATVFNESDLNISNNTTGDPLHVAGTGCAYAVTPTSVSLPASGGGAVVTVQADASCSWMVSGLPTWITVWGSSLGTGPANVTLVVSANIGAARTANVNIAGVSIAVTQVTGVCLYLLTPGGQSFPATGGVGSVDVTTTSGCSWTISNSQSWINFTGTTTRTGNGRVAYQVAPNAASARNAVLSIAGQSYRVEQSAASIPGLTTIGSLAQVASAGFWTTTFTIVNTGTTTAQVRINTYDDNGAPLQLPLAFPQNLQIAPILASTLDRTLVAGASLLISTTGPDASPVQTGWAQVSSDGTVVVYAVLRLAVGGTEQEAVVPLETRNANSYVLAFDNTAGYATGVGLANTLAQTGSISVMIKDDTGEQLQSTSISMPARGHTAFDLGARFPLTAQKRGTVEFRSVNPAQLGVLGLRFSPKGAFTTIPPGGK